MMHLWTMVSTLVKSQLQTRRTVFAEIVPLHKEHYSSIEFLMSIHDAKQVARISLGEDLPKEVRLAMAVQQSELTERTYFRAG